MADSRGPAGGAASSHFRPSCQAVAKDMSRGSPAAGREGHGTEISGSAFSRLLRWNQRLSFKDIYPFRQEKTFDFIWTLKLLVSVRSRKVEFGPDGKS